MASSWDKTKEMLRGKRFCEQKRNPISQNAAHSSLLTKREFLNFFSSRFASSLENGMKLVQEELGQNGIKSTEGVHIVMGLSGGVDSAVGALILKKLGYKVSGIHTKSWTVCICIVGNFFRKKINVQAKKTKKLPNKLQINYKYH